MNTQGHTLFIVYPPGLGGNHLMNLLSLDQRYHSDIDYSQYLKDRSENAHFTQNIELRLPQIRSQDFSLDKINIIPTHLASYLWFCDNPESAKPEFAHRKFCLINMPANRDSMAYKRFISVCPTYDEEYVYEETRTLYSLQYLKRLFDQHDWFILDSELLFNQDFDQLYQNLYLQGLVQNIDQNLARTIHQRWILSLGHQINA